MVKIFQEDNTPEEALEQAGKKIPDLLKK